jgi:hypothetical protein
MAFKVEDSVRWTSSNAAKEGVIVAVVPPGRMPCHIGFKRLGDNALPRRGESFVVYGGEPGKKKSHYWPMASLLNAAECLTPDEVAWCHRNADTVRKLIASS